LPHAGQFRRDRPGLRGARAHEAALIRIRILEEEAGPADSAELADAEQALDELAGRSSRGQGPSVSPDGRRALEDHAIYMAEQHYRDRGRHVKNVSAQVPSDLHCTRGQDELHVEVKGTQSDGRHILLTRNEVAHARTTFPQVALYVVARIQLYRDE